jgi:15-cis-phytoene synthase
MTQSMVYISPAERPGKLDSAFEACAAVTREHSKSFYLATSFLPEYKRDAIRALYAFCRATDDIVDSSNADNRHVTLARWRDEADRPWQAQPNPVLQAWTWVREHYEVPAQYAEELIDGCEMDLRHVRYNTWEELRTYCYKVASTVGLMSMHIIGPADGQPDTLERAKPFAIDLGVALQLTNILRDVGEDLRRGRVYLPAEDLLRFGYTDEHMHRFEVNDAFRKLMRFEMDRADALYDHSWQGIGLLNPDGRMAVGAASLLYRGILGQIHANSYNVFTTRAHLSTTQKLARLPGICMRVLAL